MSFLRLLPQISVHPIGPRGLDESFQAKQREREILHIARSSIIAASIGLDRTDSIRLSEESGEF
jgi:hypothetical protein